MKRDGDIERLRAALERGALRDLATSLAGYVQWRLGGSPPDPHEPIEVRLEKADAAMVVVLMRDHYSTQQPTHRPLISVILPTKDRPQRLQRAVESVITQSYRNWELLVVNDGTTTPEPATPDQRIMILPNRGKGVSSARNTALDQTKGEVIAYLDDDNVMDPHWLNAIAVTLEETPRAEVMVGAQLVTPDPGSPEHHTIRFPPRFDWRQLTRANYIDMGMLAHRPNALRFDEELPALVDWDFVVRLTHENSPLLVPALSGIYMTGSPGRVSYQDRRRLIKRMHRRFAALAPHGSEEVSALERHDMEALRTMLVRLTAQRGRRLGLLANGDRLSESVARSVSGLADQVGSDGFADVILAGDLPAAETLARLGEDGFIVGLAADDVDYAGLGMAHSRTVGDRLWLGSAKPFDPESLFEGASLVKFGNVEGR